MSGAEPIVTRAGRRSAAGRDKIMTVAARMFAEEGYEAVSTKRLALACGLTIGALYHHFDSKESLYRAVVSDAFEGLPEAPLDLFDDDSDAEAQLRRLIAWFSRTIAGDDVGAALFRHELLEPRLSGSLGDLQAFARPLARFRDLMERLAPQTESAFAEAAIIALSFGLSKLDGMRRVVGDDRIPSEPDEIADRVARLVLRGLSI